MNQFSILMLEDSPLDADLSISCLRRAGLSFHYKQVDCRRDFLAALKEQHFDLILADYALPDFDGLSALRQARETCPGTPFIIVSGVLGEETAIEALQEGASDYVLKSRLNRLAPSVERALRLARAEERERASAEGLRLAQEFGRRLLDSSRDCIMTLSLAGTIEAVNPYGRISLGLRDGVSGQPWLDIWTEGERPSAERAFEEAVAGGAGSFDGRTRANGGESRSGTFW